MYKYKSPPALTFSHRSGVTPYTSSYELAGSCVFDKQSPEILSLRPRFFTSGQALSRSYGRFFAEFLNEDSPVPLRLLASPTCGGLRYGRPCHSHRGFSWQHDYGQFANRSSPHRVSMLGTWICLRSPPTRLDRDNHHPDDLHFCVTP